MPQAKQTAHRITDGFPVSAATITIRFHNFCRIELKTWLADRSPAQNKEYRLSVDLYRTTKGHLDDTVAGQYQRRGEKTLFPDSYRDRLSQ